tara:strand:- start:70 stop:303 length:234 start_codon:yes stop_codon:yes gene_type:complete
MFFIIKVNKWSHKTTYQIMKEQSFDLTEATRKLLAYEQLNDDEDISYHLNKVEEYLKNDKDSVVLSNGSHNSNTIFE